MLADASSTTVVVFLDANRRLGPHSVGLARALNTWFRTSSPPHATGEVSPAGEADKVPVFRGVRVLVGDCMASPSLLRTFALVALPAIRVFPAGIRGALAREVPFNGSARLDHYVQRIEELHTAGSDQMADLDGVAGPAGAVLRQSARLADLRAEDGDQGDMASAQAAVVDLSKAIAARARHAAGLLRQRAERLDMVVSVLDQVSAELDPAALAADFAATAQALAEMPPAMDDATRSEDRTKLQWASTLRLLLDAKTKADERAAAGGDPVDDMVDELLNATETQASRAGDERQ